MCGKKKDCNCSDTGSAHAEQLVIPASLVAAADARLAESGYTPPDRFDAVLTVEGVRTTDRRRIEANGLSWRNLPWNIMAQFNNDGHRGAAIVGNVETVTREPWAGVDGAYLIKGNGTFDLNTIEGKRAATMVDNQTLRFGSIDLESLKSEFIMLDEEGQVYDGDIWDLFFGAEEELDFYENHVLGRIMGYTLVPMSAFPQAVIVPEGAAMDIPKPFESGHHPAKPLLASAVRVPDNIPSKWFTDPELDGPTSLMIENNGHVFGHIALWDTCHIGFQDKCINPPKSEHDYAYFKQGKIETVNDEGETELCPIGHITYNTGHAEASGALSDAVAHYDNTGTVAADIAVGEDDFGIWFNGVLRSTLDADDIRAVRAAPLSGDWRRARGGGLELVAALSVNVPGFPIVASAGMVEGEQVSLRAAAVTRTDPIKVLAREVRGLKKLIEPLRPSIVAALQERVGQPEPKPKLVSLGELRRRVNSESQAS